MKYFDELNDPNNVESSSEHGKRDMRDIVPRGKTLKLSKKGTPEKEKKPVSESVRSLPAKAPEPPIRERFELPHEKPNEAPLPPVVPEPSVEDVPIIRTWEPSSGRAKRRLRRISTSISVAALIAIFVIPTFAFPTFTITVYPKVEHYSIERVELRADTSITKSDPKNRKVPAMVLSVDKNLSQTFSATGKKFVQARAEGVITISNSFNSSPQPLVANTRFEDPRGKIFRLRAGVTVPGAKVVNGKIEPASIQARVVAGEAGDAYNIGPTTFHIPGFKGTPKYDAFTARSDSAFSGGTVGEANVATADDIRTASEVMTKRVVDELRLDLEKKVPADPDFISPAGGRDTSIVDIVSPKPDTAGAEFSVTVSGRGQLLILRTSDLAPTLVSILTPEPNALPVKATKEQKDMRSSVTALGRGSVPSNIVLDGSLSYYHESPVDDIIGALKTSTPRKAEAYLRERSEIKAFRLKRFPPWLWFIPAREGGLQVAIEAPTS